MVAAGDAVAAIAAIAVAAGAAGDAAVVVVVVVVVVVATVAHAAGFATITRCQCLFEHTGKSKYLNEKMSTSFVHLATRRWTD